MVIHMRCHPIGIFFPILLAGSSLDAKFSDRLYPIAELTDEMRSSIDLKDGSIDDWLEVLGEPTLTPLDFCTDPSWPGYDPSSYDFRIWLAWHDATNHLFVAVEIIDDFHVTEYDRYGDSFAAGGDAAVLFLVDGDRSGGTIFDEDRNGFLRQGQLYSAFSKTYPNDSNVTMDIASGYAPWVHKPPYADGGGVVVDSQPIRSALEFYVTPFDRFIWDDPDKCVVSELFSSKTIAFAMVLWDHDEVGDIFSVPDGSFDLFGPDASYDVPYEKIFYESDWWANGILLGAEGSTDDTGVESVSWGRIKASLSE